MKNPGYNGRNQGNVGQVVLHFQREGFSPLEEFMAGRLGVAEVQGLEPGTIQDLRRSYPDLYRSAPSLLVHNLFVNPIKPFNDLRVRQAFAMTVDKKSLVESLFGETQSPALGGFIPPGMPGHSPGIGLPFDPDRARQLLLEAGYPSGRGFPEPSLIAPVFGDDIFERMSRQLARVWEETLGVKVRLEIIPQTEEYMARLHEGVDPLIEGGYFADFPDPGNFLVTGLREALSGWRHPEYERFEGLIQSLTDQSTRLEYCRRMDRILMDEAVVIPLRYARQHLLVHPWVKSFPVSPMGRRYWKDIVVDRER